MKPEKYNLDELLGHDCFQQFMHCFAHNKIFKCQFNAKAEDILTPADLEEIISTRRLSFPRCRLVCTGKPLAPAEYNERSHTAMGEGVIKLIPERVMEEIENGATLALDFAEDLSTTIRAISESLSVFFQERTGATIFFSVGDEKGFTTHWDNSDTLIFQLSGKKKWHLYDSELDLPVAENKSAMPVPTGMPDESFVLNENEFLYLPRGQWHAPEPCNSHSLHISFAFRRRNGMDFVKFLLPQLASYLSFRKDINKSADNAGQERYIESLRSVLENIITVDNLNSFLASCQDRQFVTHPVLLQELIAKRDGKV
ncbi:cupin domain-containing protein [Klebsiella michiganensis]|uniref:JmjC domain-containing protein n=1 Tax=Klebsiella michiganensis TaxID=1134687 RepID=UPI0032DB8F2A